MGLCLKSTARENGKIFLQCFYFEGVTVQTCYIIWLFFKSALAQVPLL